MKILIVITHGNIGGATNSVFWLAKELKRKGLNVWVGFGEGEYLQKKLEKEKISFLKIKWLSRTYNPLSNLLFIFRLKRILDKEKFDVVHFNSTNALFGAIAVKISKSKPKTVFTFRGLSILDPNYKKLFFLKPIFWLIFKFLLLFVDSPVFVSQKNLKWALKKRLVKKGMVIYNGIPEIRFLEQKTARQILQERAKTNLENKFIIGSIGRLDYAKNYEFFIKNFSKIASIKENAIIFIIGDGPEKKKLDKLINVFNLKNKIIFLTQEKNAAQYLKAFDCFILPSIYEGFSITLLEASQAGLPILASDVGGNSEIVGKENTFSLKNESDFLEKFKKIVKEIEKGISPKVKFFRIEETAKHYLALYQQLINKNDKTI